MLNLILNTGFHYRLAMSLIAFLSVTFMISLSHAQSLQPPSLDTVPAGRSNAASELTLDPSQLNLPPVQQTQASTEPQISPEDLAREMAIRRAVDQYLPMETDEIRRVLKRLSDTQEAVQTPVRPPAKPDIHIENLRLDPSSPPPAIDLATDIVTTLSLLDVTGQPWPIVDVAFGGEFDVKLPEPGGHVLRITPLKDFATGNISVRLLDFTTPLTFILRSDGETVHYRYDARLPEYGPNALLPIITGGGGIDLNAGDRVLADMIEGIVPEEAQRLLVAGADGRTSAYNFGEGIFLRTPHTLLSPAWKSSARSAEGVNVYYVEKTPILLLSRGGEPIKVTLSRDTN